MLIAALLVALQLTGAQPPVNETTDVDENTTPAEASPLAPSKGVTTPPGEAESPGRSLDDILATVRPVETPVEPKTPEEAPRPGLILATPATSPTAVAPTFIGDRNARPDGAPTDSDILYETRVLGAFRAAQGRQGALDGRWLVARPGGEVLYTLQFADPGAGDDRIEGAWRNMKAQGLGGSGFIDTVSREDADIIVRFEDTSQGGRREEVRLRRNGDGGWIGDLSGQGRKVPVVLSRDVSVEVAAQGAPIYIPPPAPVAKASNCKRVKSKGKWKTVCGGSSSKAKAKASSSSKKKTASKSKSSRKKK